MRTPRLRRRSSFDREAQKKADTGIGVCSRGENWLACGVSLPCRRLQCKFARIPTQYAIYRKRYANSATASQKFVRPRGTKKCRHRNWCLHFFGDPWENRTPVSALRGPCLSRLTNGPFVSRSIIITQRNSFVNTFFEKICRFFRIYIYVVFFSVLSLCFF